ncbi:antibiotic biosynthesis monooxygenase [Flammeovirga sp. OC4]|uniref:antibiotic biosynthesis monooxygenase family protein n=1 Tax=Flammeovirga sp. OC4 TaxID=1382345 RepID=UPI0005C7888E|nr:antibiotic biosynthesis monooxygenase [Flammeovirga sp. OC4]
MIAVLFEVLPKEEQKQEYLEIASKLRPMLEEMEGFISIERFQSLQNPKKMLSLSYWKDEKSIETWRKNILHREEQAAGKNSIFSKYTIRVGQIIREYTNESRKEAPEDSNRYHQ